MNRIFPLFLFALLLPLFASAQNCPCCQKRDAGEVAFARKDYKTALIRWQEGLKLPDAANCADLKDLVAKAESKLKYSNAPDRDKDGVPDAEDACPDEPGQREFKGCIAEEPVIMEDDGHNLQEVIFPKESTDRDEDGVVDQEDQCPDMAGTKSNRGCPVLVNLDSVGMLPEMVLVPGGTFTMGDIFGEGYWDDKPLRTVTVSDFYLGKTEVTFQNFDVFCQATGRPLPAQPGLMGRGQYPVVNANWYDAIEYCNWLSSQQHLTPVYTLDKSRQDPNNTSKDDPKKWLVIRNPDANGYRLPTEAEWEYAAREGGKQVRFGTGKDTADAKQLNAGRDQLNRHYPYSIIGKESNATVEAGSLRSPNALGLHDMSGNVQEWCGDWAGRYPAVADTNPMGIARGYSRVVRGGSFRDDALGCRTTRRSSLTPSGILTGSYGTTGFRVAASGSSALKSMVAEAKNRPSILDRFDMDKDGIVDQEDQCPSLGGPEITHGCPQTIAPNDTNSITKGMVAVRGGTFIMGDLFKDPNGNERQHTVTVSDFSIGRTEVTFKDFDAFCAATGREKPADSGWGRDQRPVIHVDWYDAVEYCNWLSEQQGKTPAYTIDKNRPDSSNTYLESPKRWTVTRNHRANGYRLPTEAEWEYAAREGGKKVRFGNGKDQADAAQFNFDASEAYMRESYSYLGEGRKKTVEVGSLHSPNALGLHDMSGNVEEWCADWCNINIDVSVKTNPEGSRRGSTRVVRGSSYLFSAQFCRAANRNNGAPTLRDNATGFRLAASLQ